MKKIKLIPISLLGFSLAFGLVTFARAPEAKAVDAAETFFIGMHNMLSNTTCTDYSGKASLSISGGSYVLTLEDNFSNNNVETSMGTTSAAMVVGNLTRPLIIKVKGTCTLSTDDTSREDAYGIYVASTTNNMSITIQGEGSGTNKLKISSPTASNSSYGIFTQLANVTASLSVSNCEVEAKSAVSTESCALNLEDSTLSIGSNATVTATSLGIDTSDTSTYHMSAGINCTQYTQTGGTVKATAGNVNKRGYSNALLVTSGNVTVQNGRLEAKAGNSDKFSTIGINVRNGSVILNSGAEVVAEAGQILASDKESGARAYGIQLGTTSSGNQVSIGANANYLYAITNHSENIIGWGINTNINASFAGYASDSDIFSDENRSTVAAGNHTYIQKKQVLFQRVQYTATGSSPVTYDESTHNPLTVSVTYPTSATVQYRLQGDSGWSNSAPQLDKAKEEGYVVEYKISASKFVPVIGQVTFVIHKAAASLDVIPSIVADFDADGNTLVPLAVAGEATGGTLMYTRDGVNWSTEIPSVKYAGEYEVQYKVVGDANHDDIEPVSIGTVVVGGVEMPEPDPEPTPEPIDPAKPNKGIGAGGVIGIVLGSLVFVVGAAYLVLFFLLNKWIKVGDKAVRVMRFALGSKDGKERYLSFKCKFEYRDKSEVFNTKDEALK